MARVQFIARDFHYNNFGIFCTASSSQIEAKRKAWEGNQKSMREVKRTKRASVGVVQTRERETHTHAGRDSYQEPLGKSFAFGSTKFVPGLSLLGTVQVQRQ